MEIFPNWTVAPIVLFLILLTYILNRMFFRPLGATLEERHSRIEGAQKEAEEIRKASKNRLVEFETKMREARRESDQIMAQMKNEALSAKSGIVSGKRVEAETLLVEAREDIRQKTEEARKQLEAQSEAFAYQIASHILKRSVR